MKIAKKSVKVKKPVKPKVKKSVKLKSVKPKSVKPKSVKKVGKPSKSKNLKAVNGKFVTILLKSNKAHLLEFFTNTTNRQQAIEKLIKTVPETLKIKIINNKDKEDQDTDIYYALDTYGAK